MSESGGPWVGENKQEVFHEKENCSELRGVNARQVTPHDRRKSFHWCNLCSTKPHIQTIRELQKEQLDTGGGRSES